MSDLQIGHFKRKVRTGTDIYDENLELAEGNEQSIMKATITITAVAANADFAIIPVTQNWQQRRFLLRPTTAVVNPSAGGAQVFGVIKTSSAAQGIAAATLTDSNATVTINTTNLGTDTLNTTEVDFAAQLFRGGTNLVLRHVQAVDGGAAAAAGVIRVSVQCGERYPG